MAGLSCKKSFETSSGCCTRSHLHQHTVAHKRMEGLLFVDTLFWKALLRHRCLLPTLSDDPTCSLFKPPPTGVTFTMIPYRPILDHQHASILLIRSYVMENVFGWATQNVKPHSNPQRWRRAICSQKLPLCSSKVKKCPNK